MAKLKQLGNFFSLVVGIVCLMQFLPFAYGQNITTESMMTTTEHPDDGHTGCTGVKPCKKGYFLPVWEPVHDLSVGDKAARAVVYLVALIFMFLGVSIIADRFMAAIEVITSKEKEVHIKMPNGEVAVVVVRVWNETVSNLTLMALGSSAPEILLSIIEVVGGGFEAGDLGPGTIVGSAAFNLFVIIAICVYVIPDDEVRRIKHLRVFFITASWSIFAYLWLYLIIAVISRGRVDVWEALVTFCFFPVTVLTAYIADRRFFVGTFLAKRYRTNRSKTVVVSTEGGDVELADGKANHVGDVTFKGLDADDEEVREFEKHRKEYIQILRELRKKHPNIDMKTLEEMAEYEAMNRGPKSRAFYRIQATRRLTGGGNVIKKSKIERRSSIQDVKLEVPEDDHITKVFFDPGHYTVMENIGSFALTVTRSGGNLENTIYVDYKTEDGTANAGSDYERAEGTLVFLPGETHKQFSVSILDDDIFEEDEHFYVQLSNIRVGDMNGMFHSNQVGEPDQELVQLATPFMATVMILDDDHAGIFHFMEPEFEVVESVGEANVKVTRASGARGRVRVPYHMIEGTAKNEKDFESSSGYITFENDETEQFIPINIVDGEEYEKNIFFTVVLDEPQLVRRGSVSSEETEFEQGKGKEGEEDELIPNNIAFEKMTEEQKVAELGKPRLGERTKIVIRIRESLEFKSTVDKLLKKANLSLVVGTSSWREQFIDAVSVSAGDDDDGDEDGEERLPSCMDYVMHYLTIFWKVLFAIVPPTDYWGGWACFCVSIGWIGILTAFIGDIAASFGCSVGLKDTVTAISFVALGTSVPDYWGGWASFVVCIFFIGILTTFIGDLASHFGCTVGLLDSVTAISFVALGTSVPDTFASKVAAIGDKYADSSIGNVTGSNAVNVFLGIGLAWSIAAVKHAISGTEFRVEPGSLGFSVTIFCIFAAVAICVLMFRRKKFIGGELGGPRKFKIPTTILLCSLWILYVLLSSLESYCHITGF